MLSRLKGLFKKREGMQLENFLKSLKTGDWVEMEYCNPKDVGIISENTLSNTRLNADELKDRVIRGCIERVQYEYGPRAYSVKIKTFKINQRHLVVREFMLMDYEITNYRRMQ